MLEVNICLVGQSLVDCCPKGVYQFALAEEMDDIIRDLTEWAMLVVNHSDLFEKFSARCYSMKNLILETLKFRFPGCCVNPLASFRPPLLVRHCKL